MSKGQLCDLELDIAVEKFYALADAVHGHQGEIKMLANLEAYMDESADKDVRLFVVGGFIARTDNWGPLLYEWAARIRDASLPSPIKAFHMTDCVSGGGEFRDKFGWNNTSRKRLVDDLVDLLCRYTVGMFGIGVQVEQYESLDRVTDEGIRLGYSQYHLLFQAVMSYMAKEFEENDFPYHETIAFFFDRNSRHETWANTLHKELQNSKTPWSHRIGSLTFANKEVFQLLQVADLGAYESRRYLAHKIYGDCEPGPAFQKLANHHCIWRLDAFNKNGMQKIIEIKKEELGHYAKSTKRKGK